MSSKELWHPDIKIDIDIAKVVIEQQFKSLAPLTSISKIDEGWDNAVFLVDDCYIFRFPRRQLGVSLIDRENMLLPNIIDRFDINIPNPVFIGRPDQNYPYPFQGYKKLMGQ